MTDRFRLDGKVAVVTGALGRLGAVWVEALLESGARVLGLDLPGHAVSDGFARLQKAHGEKLRLASADVTARDALEAALRGCVKDLGPPDVLVNNAGIDQPPARLPQTFRLEDIPLDVCRAILEVNVLGLFLTTQVFGREMAARRRGSIINLGSLYTDVSPDVRLYDHIPGDPPFLKPPAYGASKAAVHSLTLYFAAHWGPFQVRVNTLSPGGILGDQDAEFRRKFCDRVPLGRMGTAEDLKGPLLFLASDASQYVTGIQLAVDGGFRVW